MSRFVDAILRAEGALEAPLVVKTALRKQIIADLAEARDAFAKLTEAARNAREILLGEGLCSFSLEEALNRIDEVKP